MSRLASKLQPECLYTMTHIHLFIEQLPVGKETFDSLYRPYMSYRYQLHLGADLCWWVTSETWCGGRTLFAADG